MLDPRNPAQVIQGPHTQLNMTQPPVQHGAYIPDPSPQGPFLPYDLPQGPYMWNPNPQSPFFQNNLPQGPGMLNPHQPGPYVQNPQPQGPYMCNPNAQGPFMLNPYSQGPYMHTSHPQGPFMMNYYAQGPYMHNLHSQAPNMNYPYTEGPYMNNPIPQRPLQSHYPEGIYMCNQQSLGDCMPNQQTTDGVHAKSAATGIPANTGLWNRGRLFGVHSQCPWPFITLHWWGREQHCSHSYRIPRIRTLTTRSFDFHAWLSIIISVGNYRMGETGLSLFFTGDLWKVFRMGSVDRMWLSVFNMWQGRQGVMDCHAIDFRTRAPKSDRNSSVIGILLVWWIFAWFRELY